VRGLNALAATISTPLAAPVIAATRLRGGNAASCRGAASFATAAVATARNAGCSGILVARADSAFYSAAVIGAVRRAGAFFSVTVRMDPKVKAAIAAIPETAWTPIRYPRAIWDDQLRAWVSDAQVAETEYTAGPLRCAATSSTSPPAWPATATATSPCTCPENGTASRSG
jgi:hypothetical protein